MSGNQQYSALREEFEIVPNQFATMWQKLKWLFSSKIEFEWVDNLGNADRGGHGKTGVK